MEKETAHLAEDCPCVQVACPIHGDCVACIRGHREHKRHLPECMQDLVREQIAALAEKVEMAVVDKRRTPADWEPPAEEAESG